MNHKTIVLALICFLLSFTMGNGCKEELPPTPTFSGEVEYQRENGTVTWAKITFTTTGSSSVTVYSIADAEALRNQLESTLKDLDYVIEQMARKEPVLNDSLE